MARRNSQIVGTAGEHFVAFRLAQQGFIVALPRMGSPLVDLLVSNTDGSRTVTIQVKTTEWAVRERGRKPNRKPYELQFPLGKRAARVRVDRFVFTFVDLKGRKPNSNPDVYVVPSEFIYNFCRPWVENTKWVRWHVSLEEAEPFKNDWDAITGLLT